MGSLSNFICVKLLSIKRETCRQQICVVYFFKTMFSVSPKTLNIKLYLKFPLDKDD